MRFILFSLVFIWVQIFAQETVRCGKARYTIEGILSNTSSYKPIMKQNMGIKPEIGAKGELLKYFTSNLFGGKMSGTLVIAEVEILAISGSSVTLKVLEEKSQIIMNGKKKNHFLKGNKVKLNVYDYQQPREKIEYWENGNRKSKGMMVCGKKLGQWSYYDLKGNLSKVYSLNEDGEIDGEYLEFHPNGKIALKGTYDDDEKKGEWKSYNPDGSDGGFINYRYGKKHGKYKLVYPNGQTKEIGEYDYRGKIEGVQIGYYENGKKKFQYDEDKRTLQEWYEDGTLKKEFKLDYSGEKKDGLCKEYYENGQLKSAIEYDDDEYEGDYKKYYENGQIKVEGEYKWTDHKKTGEWKEYYKNGQVKYRRNYYAGKMKGRNESFYESGNQKISANYIDGEPEGEVLSYHENGKLKTKAYFKEGKKVGTWSHYFEDGSLKSQRSFVDDKMEGVYSDYYEPGKLKEKGSKKGMLYSGPYEKYYENGNLHSKGNFTEDGKRTGAWVFNFENGKVKKKGTYLDGKKTGKWIEVDENGKKKKVKYD